MLSSTTSRADKTPVPALSIIVPNIISLSDVIIRGLFLGPNHQKKRALRRI